jgi:hypothetical protein
MELKEDEVCALACSVRYPLVLNLAHLPLSYCRYHTSFQVHGYRPIVAPPPICRRTLGRSVELADAKISPATLPPSAVSVQGKL